MFNQDVNNSFREKLLVLYLLKEINIALSIGEIEEIMLSEEIMDLFIINKTLGELSETKLIDEINDTDIVLYKTNDLGKESLNAFKDKINDYHKAKLDMSINIFKRKKSKEKFINAKYKKVDKDETIVECEINEMDTKLIKVELRVPTNEQGEKICKAWNNRGVEIFQEILKLFE